MDHLHLAPSVEDGDLFDYEEYGIEFSIQDPFLNFSPPTPDMADLEAFFQVEEPLNQENNQNDEHGANGQLHLGSTASQGEVQQGDQSPQRGLHFEGATSQRDVPGNSASSIGGYQNNGVASQRNDQGNNQNAFLSYQFSSTASQRDDEIDWQNFFSNGYEYNSAADQAEAQAEDQSFVSSHQIESATSPKEVQGEDQSFMSDHQIDSATIQGEVQGDNQSFVGDPQIDSAASLIDVQSDDGSLDGDDQINSAASQGDIQSDNGSQEDSQNDSADETSVDGHVQHSQGVASLQAQDQTDPEIDIQGEIDNMTADGIYKGLILDFADHLSEPRMSRELREIKTAGIPVRQLSNVEVRYWVGRLFLAFKNVEGILDKKSKKGKPAQATQRLQGSYYPDRVIEQMCWQIVLDCSLSANGIRLVDTHHNAKCEKFDSFETRMTKIVDFCKVSKAACKQLLDPTYHDRLIDAPGYESFVKDTNRKINHKRDIQNMIGRSAMRSGGVKFNADLDLVKDDDYEEAYESENEDESPQSLAGTPPAKKGTLQPRPQESSPASPLALKRKRRSISAKNYRQSDEDGTEESDVSEYKEVDDAAKEAERSGPKRRAVESFSGTPATPTPLALPPRKSVAKKHQSSTPVAGTQFQEEPQGGSLSATPPGGDAFDPGSLDDQIYKGLGAMIDEVQSAWGITAASGDIVEDSMRSSVTDRLPTATAALASADQRQDSMSSDVGPQSHGPTISATTSIAHPLQGNLSSGDTNQSQFFMSTPSTASLHGGSMSSLATHQTQGTPGSGAAHLRRASMSLGSADQHRHSVELANAYAGLGSMKFDFAVQPQGFMGPAPVPQAQDYASSASNIASLYGLFPALGPATQAPGPLAFSSAIQPHGFMAPIQASQAPGTTGSNFHSAHFALPRASSMALKYDIPGPASDNNDIAKSQYKLVICEILNVHRLLSSYYTLEELRMYGRAYNHQFWNDTWEITVQGGKKFTCKAFRLISPSKGVVPHFALYQQKFAFLAVCRGDLTPDAEFNDKSPYMNGFATNGNALFNMALGVIPNPYGMIDPQTLEPRDNSEFFGNKATPLLFLE